MWELMFKLRQECCQNFQKVINTKNGLLSSTKLCNKGNIKIVKTCQNMLSSKAAIKNR